MQQTGLSDLEKELVLGCSQGKREAQHKLYSTYYQEMSLVCMRYVKTKEEAGEILNDGFFKVFKLLLKEQPDRSLKALVRKIMILTSIDHYRVNQKHYYQFDVEHSNLQYFSADAIDEMSVDEILSYVQKLPDSYRIAFNLYVLDGYQHNEIAAMLGISEGTSKSNLSKARAKLQVMIRANSKIKLAKYAG